MDQCDAVGVGSGGDDHLKVKHVYALLTDRYRISRNIRVEWFLENLNRFFPPLEKKNSLAEFKNEIDIISFISEDQSEEDHRPPKNHSKFLITCDSKFTFFSRKYCFVYVLDMSTSVANVDIQHSTILTDELYNSLAKCLTNIVKPFYVPGSEFLFEPEIYITIVAYLPFYSVDVNNVIIHGYKLSSENITQLLSQVRTKIYYFIGLLHSNIKSEDFRDEYAHNMNRNSGKSIVPPNLSLINMIRFGLLSLNLLPENSHQGIVIVTDGNTSFSDAYTLESALAQLRLSMISCSFIHIGSPPHPDFSLGYVPYIDFMDFIAQATFGAYLSISSNYDCDFENNRFNIFHRAFFVYSFNYGSCSLSKFLCNNGIDNSWTIDNPYFYSYQNDEIIRSVKKDQQMLKRKQLESQINASFAQILSYRLREGFTIKKVVLDENKIDLALILPWRHNVNIEYHIKAEVSAYFQRNGSIPEDEDINFTKYEVFVESNYSFLYDASCPKKVFKSPLRATTIKQFCAALKHFNDSDNLGIHFHHFAKNELYRSIPETIKNVSLFYLPPSSNVPVVSVPNETHEKFAQYWRPICMLDVNMCQKSSLHTHQINILLKHDYPLPEFLYQPNSSGRYESIQCKQTMSVLNVVLKEWSSFVLLENHSYIKLIKEKENKSCSFYLIRIIAQPPCLVLHLAFIGGTSGSLRNQIVNELSQKLKQCKLPQRNLSSSLMQKSTNVDQNTDDNDDDDDDDDEDGDGSQNSDDDIVNDDSAYSESEQLIDNETSTDDENDENINLDDDNQSNSNNNNSNSTPGTEPNTPGFRTLSSQKRNSSSNSTTNCFIILNRPIERMLIRYEKIPKDFYSCYKYEEDWRQKNTLTSYASLNMFQTLSRFLYHKRFIWCTHDSRKILKHSSKLKISSLSKILYTLTMKRIKEGFTIAYNECGVVNLVKEFMMKEETNTPESNDEKEFEYDGANSRQTQQPTYFPCLVQYIIFPSNVIIRDSDDCALNDHYGEEHDDDDGQEDNDCCRQYNNCIVDDDGGGDDPNRIVCNNDGNTTVTSNDDDDCYYRHDGSNKHLIVTECWIEPQNGRSIKMSNNQLTNQDTTTTTLDGLTYDQISSSFYKRDFELVSVLLTYEYMASYDSSKHHHNNDVCRNNVSGGKIPKPLNAQNPIADNDIDNKRFKHIPFRFDLLNIFDKSQQALIKFSTLYQLFDFNPDEIPLSPSINDKEVDGDSQPSSPSSSSRQSWNNCTNIMLYSEFLRKISQLHDEISFDHTETISFIKKTNERLSRRYPDEPEALFSYIEELAQDPTVVFRCFCKKFSDDCIILILLPSSYKVVCKLIFVDYMTGKINKRLIGKMENRDENICYGSLIIPIIVHKLTSSSLNNILLNNSEQLCPNWELLFDYSIHNNNENFYSNQNVTQSIENYSQSIEITLETFAKSIDALFRNSFTDAIYKSLRYGFETDNRDVRLVLEKICNKSIGFVDITNFLIYTCKHMKPVINAYFERYPSNSIFDLLNYIASKDFNQNSNNQNDILTLKLTVPPLIEYDQFGNRICNCCNHNEALKKNFVNLIQSHFSSIPSSNSYYFYDFENIQMKKFSFGAVDVKKKKEKLIELFEKIENNEIEFEKFYEEIKSSSHTNKDNVLYDEFANDPQEYEDEEIIHKNDEEKVDDKEINLDDFQSLIVTKPFFVGFFYSMTLKNDTQIRKIPSIPTCLLEILSNDNDSPIQETLEMENFRVYLNVEIITQNIEPQNPPSNCSNDLGIGVNMDGGQTSMLEDNGMTGYLPLDSYQIWKYTEFFNRIQWMIRDEIVSISHNMFQICPRTLAMVVNHIDQRHMFKSNTSFVEKAEVKFVFQIDEDPNFLPSFREELSRLKFSNFRLWGLDQYFYVIHDTYNEHSKGNDSQTMIFTTFNTIDGTEEEANNLVLNEELFDPPRESLVAEYTIEESISNFSPNFWLILLLEFNETRGNFINYYFHSRQNIYLYGSEILNQLKKSVELLCKKFNQKYLLARLFENRICDELLIPKDDPDPFIKNTVRSTLNSTPISNFWDSSINSNFNDLDYDSFENLPLKVSNRINFVPGSFMCDIVWDKHFPLHPRLHSSSSKDGSKTVRSVLNTFLVTNRSNLYVYKEKSDAVFYMRIYEIECSTDSFTEDFKKINLESQNDFELTNFYHDNLIQPSMNVSLSTTTTTGGGNTSNSNADDESKCDSDNDSVNSLNVNRTMNVPQQCILMNVHGIQEPSKEIKEDMVQALQRKLDESVLDILIIMLSRNPLSKLSHQDVTFIQGRNSVLKNLYFVINECYYPYILNIKGYIRQNLSTFLYNPKYTDRNPEFHFKLFKNGEFHCVKDEDIFLYHCQEESGKDTKGIACVIFSIVSKEKLPEMTPSTFNVSQMDMNDFVSGYFDYMVTVCNPVSKENLNVKFCINFQVWYAGKIDKNYLNQKLRTAICHSLWEFNLEFKIFKLCTFEDGFNVNSISEPSTPKKINEKRERRTGLSSVVLKPPLLQLDDNKFFRKGYDKYGQASSSTIIETVGQEDYFDFSNVDHNHSVSPQDHHHSFSTLMTNMREIKNKELICLSHFLKVAIKPWLDYGKQISVPSITRCEYPIQTKRAIFSITKEFKEYISKFSSDMKMHSLMSSGQQYYEFDCNSEFCLNDDDSSIMILLRHELLWRSRFLHQSENSFVQNFIKKCDPNKLEFPPIYNLTTKSINDSNLALNNSNAEPESIRCLSPRQKFLFLSIEDQKITVYIYNWSNKITSATVLWFSNMVLWHNARSILMQSLILQKAGIFHNIPFKRYTLEDLANMSNVSYKNNLMKNMTSLNSQMFLNADLLLQYENPYQAFNENKDQLRNKIDFIFDTKNYDYVFSDFDSTKKNQTLFDCFHGQFNSNFNVYIKDLKELSKVWQLHGTKLNYPTMDKIIQHVKSYGRLSHYCLTPFLFSHKWRFVISLIRDHSLPLQVPRVRHMSGGNILKPTSNEHEFLMAKQRSRRKSGPPNMLENSLVLSGHGRTSSDESLDMAVCPHYIQEYVQYLQSLGFSSIKSQKVSSVTTRKTFDFEKRYDNYYNQSNKYKTSSNISAFSTTSTSGIGSIPTNRKTSQHSHLSKIEYEKFYLIKTVIGGFYLFEIGFNEPFVYSYLYSIDSKRFISWTKNNSNSYITNFLDELDNIMVRMHLHSFTYDYHLRAIHSYITGRQLFQRGYHLISFLDDFIKYYQKAPNYSRNHVYSDNLIFESQKIPADQLYNYLIKHNQNYGITVFSMNSTFSSSFDHSISGMNEEYVLVHLSSHRIPYEDENSIQKEDNFDLALLVSYQKINNARVLRPRQLCLKFYLLLTSQRELFPKLCLVRDKGRFQTIRMLTNSNTPPGSIPENNGGQQTNEDQQQQNQKSVLIRNPIEDNIHNSIDNSTYLGICDEKINYLGYFNPHEICMLNILEQKVNETKKFLENIIKKAEIDCRRDYLWECLLGGGSLINHHNNNHNYHQDLPMTIDDFNELLSLVKSIRLDEYDNNLMQFNVFNYNWYKTLATKLEIKFEFTYRKFFKNGSLKMAFFKNNCKDCFIMFHLFHSSQLSVEFRIVFNKPSSIQIDQPFLNRCNPQYHELVEDFVNTCTSHMWSTMLS